MSRTAELAITGLAAGGDGVGRDAGKVVFVPRTAPGDVVRVRITEERAGFARGELVELVRASADRVVPPCDRAGVCGGCAWQHVDLAAQRAAKQAIVAGALRKAIARGMELRPIRAGAEPLGWRRRARLHVAAGRVGFFAARSHAVVDGPCAQLDPRLDRALAAVRAAAPPDGELDLALGHAGDVVVATAAAWPGAAALVGTAGIVGVEAGGAAHGARELELEPGLWARAGDFAQASLTGNLALVAEAVAALGPARGRLLELHAGGGNFTRALVAAGWEVTAADVVPPRRARPDVHWLAGPVAAVVARLAAGGAGFAGVLLDPPRAGAREVMGQLFALAPAVVYVSCDPATLGRDLEALGGAPRFAQPLDLMPQTSHVEVVVRVDAAPG